MLIHMSGDAIATGLLFAIGNERSLLSIKHRQVHWFRLLLRTPNDRRLFVGARCYFYASGLRRKTVIRGIVSYPTTLL